MPLTSGRGKLSAYSREGGIVKYGELNLGQIEAIVNKLGGMEGVRRFLSGNLEMVNAKKLLQPITTVSIAAIESFRAEESFMFGDNFEKQFGHCEAAEIRIHRLVEPSLDAPILAELGDSAEISLGQFFSLLSRQGKGEVEPFLTDSYTNFAYIRDDVGVLWAVRADWRGGDDGWIIGANPVEHPNGCNAGDKIVSR